MKILILIRPQAPLQPRALEAIRDAERTIEVEHLPRCEAQRSTRYASGYEMAHPDKTCSMRARYQIDGVHLCPRHAGEIALSYMLTKEKT